MINLGGLSNFDEQIINNIRNSKLLIVDLDGTLIDFEKIDNIIIFSLFKDNKIICAIDKFLWKVNKLDIIGNGYFGLKVRLFVYSLFCKYSYKDLKRRYGELYNMLSKQDIYYMYFGTVKELLKHGYVVEVVTKNVYAPLDFASELVGKNFTFKILRKNKNRYIKEKIKKFRSACIIGNNFTDDILTSYRLKLPYIYVGNSKLVIKIINKANKTFKCKGVYVSAFEEAKNLIIK